MVLALIMLIIGLGVAAAGVRGRRVGDGRFCGGCGFDLFGLPGDRDACPECGHRLGGAGGVVRGRRQRAWVGALAGGVVAACAAAVLVEAAADWARGYDWRRHYPVGWLRADAADTHRPDAAAALAELRRRVAAGGLAPATLDALLVDAAALRADPARPWLPAWGDLAWEAMASGATDPAARTAFADVLWAPTLPRWIPDRDVVWSRSKPAFNVLLPEVVGLTDDRRFFGRVRLTGSRFGDRAVEQTPLGRDWWTFRLGNGRIMHMGQWAEPLPPGDTPPVIACEVELLLDEAGPTLARHRFELSRPLRVVADGTPLLPRFRDPQLAETIRAALARPGAVQLHATRRANGTTGSTFVITTPRLAEPLAFAASFAPAGGTGGGWRGIDVYFSAGKSSTRRHATGPALVPEGTERFDLILRPDERVALGFGGVGRILDHEVVVRGLPVAWTVEPPGE